jgi:large subunit ribosomal protein L3
MARHHQPRKGSVAFSPRKRAARESPHITSWPESKEPGLLGFPGYKVGMTHVTMLDNTKNSPTEGMEISTPVTVVETPPVVVFGIRAYKKTSRGIKAMTDVLAAELDQDLKTKISLPKEYNTETQLAELTENLDNVVEIRALVHTKPRLANVPKKKPEIMEFGVGGSSPKEKLDYAVNVLGKEINPADVFADGEHTDAVAITKGKGFQGVIKRWGVRIQYGKAARSSKGRHVGSIGPWSPERVMWTVPMAGQMGYHQRTEYNKKILKIGEADQVDEINPEGGFVKYGVVKNNYLLLKGSLPGPSKRLVIFRKAIRPHGKHDDAPQISYISTASKQGA